MTNMNEGLLQKGYQTSEFYIVIAVLMPWLCNQLGIDVGALLRGAEQMRQEIQIVHGDSNLPVAVAGVFVAARAWLKHKRMV